MKSCSMWPTVNSLHFGLSKTIVSVVSQKRRYMTEFVFSLEYSMICLTATHSNKDV